MEFKIESWIIIAIVAFVAAGSVKGILGIGLPVTAIGLMAQFVDPATAISLIADVTSEQGERLAREDSKREH